MVQLISNPLMSNTFKSIGKQMPNTCVLVRRKEVDKEPLIRAAKWKSVQWYLFLS